LSKKKVRISNIECLLKEGAVSDDEEEEEDLLEIFGWEENFETMTYLIKKSKISKLVNCESLLLKKRRSDFVHNINQEHDDRLETLDEMKQVEGKEEKVEETVIEKEQEQEPEKEEEEDDDDENRMLSTQKLIRLSSQPPPNSSLIDLLGNFYYSDAEKLLSKLAKWEKRESLFKVLDKRILENFANMGYDGMVLLDFVLDPSVDSLDQLKSVIEFQIAQRKLPIFARKVYKSSSKFLEFILQNKQNNN